MDLSEIAAIVNVPEAQVLEVARQIRDIWTIRIPALERVTVRNHTLAIDRVPTLDFVEGVAVFSMLRALNRTQLCILEVGTQYGVSACIFREGLMRMGITPRIVTYDITAMPHYFQDHEVEFRQEDITNRCGAVLDELNPDMVFLDAHPWHLTYNLTVEARRRKRLLMMHDVNDAIWEHHLQNGLLPVQGNECNTGVQWERKVLEVVFGPGIHSRHHRTDDYAIDLICSQHGVAICRPV